MACDYWPAARQGTDGGIVLPRNRYPLSTVEFIHIEDLPIGRPKFVHEAGNLYVEATILGDFDDTFFAPPLDRVDTIPGFSDAERGLRNII